MGLLSVPVALDHLLLVLLAAWLVLARSVFNHSMNYRSVVVLGTAREVTGTAPKVAAMRALVDHLMPGRWEEARQPSASEIAGTIILELPLTEASAKVRTGPPDDDESEDTDDEPATSRR